MKPNSDKQYFGSCRKCENKTAVIESFCEKCRVEFKEEYEEELNKMGYEI